MSLIIATGSNIGDSKSNLQEARAELEKHFTLIAQSRIYTSAAVDYLNQPDFFNQVLEFQIPKQYAPEDVMDLLLKIELSMGRKRDISKGPRTIDIDMIFWGLTEINTPLLTVPHPRWSQRSFIVYPLQELPFFKTIEKCFTIPKSFDVEALPISDSN
jgi:2-amino-4-hydroxy-6-hydroxymethyldihydropteridine diphosphokinase